MKLKNLTIAIAMASLGVASFGVQAEDGTAFYGSVRVGVEHNSDADTTTLRNYYSRMGFKAETEIADGLKGFGHYEFSVGTDSSAGDSGVGTRKAYVGLKGGFGRVRMGQDYHTFYNTVIAPADQGWDSGAVGSSDLGTYTGRTGEAITYDTTVGAVSVGATGYLNDDAMQDGYEIGASFDAGPVKVGVGYTDTDGKGKAWGIGAGGKMGPAAYGLTYTDKKDTGTSIDAHAAFGNVYVNLGQADLDAGTKPSNLALGYTHEIGKKTTAWFEVQKTDNDAGTKATKVKAVLKYDF